MRILKLSILMFALLITLFAFSVVASASCATYHVTGTDHSFSYPSYYNYGSGYYYQSYNQGYNSNPITVSPNQTTALRNLSATLCNNTSNISSYLNFTWYQGDLSGILANTSSSNSLSITISPGGMTEVIAYSAGEYWTYNPGTSNTAYLSYDETYNTYQMDGYSSYIDANGFVHFVITQNTPATFLSYYLVNTSTGNYTTASNISTSSFEIVDTNPKAGATNTYKIVMVSNSYYYFGSPANLTAQYQNILIQTPGDIATYNAVTLGKGGDGKSLDAAYDQANAANTNATNASNRSYYAGTYGGASDSVANISGYMRYNQLPAMATTLNNLSTTLNNLSGADKTPPDPCLQTVSGAVATSGSSIQAVLDIKDPDDTTFTYSLDNVNYSPVPANKIITLPVNNLGQNVIFIYVKDLAGNMGSNTIVIRKL